jgi:hypothetical protein
MCPLERFTLRFNAVLIVRRQRGGKLPPTREQLQANSNWSRQVAILQGPRSDNLCHTIENY